MAELRHLAGTLSQILTQPTTPAPASRPAAFASIFQRLQKAAAISMFGGISVGTRDQEGYWVHPAIADASIHAGEALCSSCETAILNAMMGVNSHPESIKALNSGVLRRCCCQEGRRHGHDGIHGAGHLCRNSCPQRHTLSYFHTSPEKGTFQIVLLCGFQISTRNCGLSSSESPV